MKKIAIILALVIVVGALILLLVPEPTTAPAPQTNAGADAPTPPSTPIKETSPETTPDTTLPARDIGMEFPIPDEDIDSADALVTYTPDGFSPETITISRGDTVRFLNQSNQKMWVASKNHPTHELYPVKSPDDCFGSSFDQCAGVDAGVFWDFTFTVAGTFGFYNHLRAQDEGEIIVQ